MDRRQGKNEIALFTGYIDAQVARWRQFINPAAIERTGKINISGGIASHPADIIPREMLNVGGKICNRSDYACQSDLSETSGAGAVSTPIERQKIARYIIDDVIGLKKIAHYLRRHQPR